MPISCGHIVYVDESGDHSLTSVDPAFPVFVLAFCIFRVTDYVNRVVPAIEALKFEFFGHDMVVLHERDIRKSIPPFDILLNASIRESFLARLSVTVRAAPFTVIACVVDKRRLQERSSAIPANPYNVALGACLERVLDHICSDRGNGMTNVVFESRGKKEDGELATEFRRITSTPDRTESSVRLAFVCANKQTNSSGLQLADLVARPIGLRVLRPDQLNQAWDLIEHKFTRPVTISTSVGDSETVF